MGANVMQQLPPGFEIDAQPAPQPAQTAQQGIIRGPQRTMGPGEAQRLQLQQQGQANTQAIQAENLRLRQQSEARAAEKESREVKRKEQGFDATEGERKAGAFLIRALGSNASYERTGEGARSLPKQALRDAFPSLENYFNTGERQVADSAQDEFIAASLRQDSGAAIPEEEMERQRRIYFPMPGDGPEAIEQKRQARLRAIVGLEQSAGRLRESSVAEFEKLQEKLFGNMEGSEPAVAENDEPAVSGGLDFGATGKSYGDDGGGNPLIISGQDGLQVLLAARGADGAPTYGSASENPSDQVNPDALGLLKTIENAQELEGDPGKIDLAVSGVTLGLSDEASGIGAALGGALTGDFDVAGNFQQGQQADLYRRDQARQNEGAVGTATELLGAGGAIRAVGGVTAAARAARGVRASGAPVNRAAIQSAMKKRAAVEGGGIGALAGAAEGDSLAERGTNALIGAGLGAPLGFAGQAVGNRLANSANAAPKSGQNALMQAADSIGVEPIPAAVGGRTTQALTAGMRQGIVSDIPITRSVERMQSQGLAAREGSASKAGQALDSEDAGNLIRQGAQVYSKRTSEIGGRLYERADARAGNASFPLTSAVRAARQELNQIQKAPGGDDSSMAKELRKLIKDMGGRRVDVEGTRALRTSLRNEIMQRGMRGSPEDRIYKKILDATDDDMVAGLEAEGKQSAVQALKTANEFWRTRVETIDQVLDPVLGKNSQKSGEQIVTALEAMAKERTGNASRLRRLMAAMPDDEASAVRATVISRMGRPTKGSSDDQAGFSFNTFLTNWNDMSARSRAIMFPKESAKILDKLATVSQGVKRAQGLENSSNTARAIGVQAITGPAWFFAPMTTAAATGAQFGFAKLLASPKFARILAGAPKKATPAARKSLDKRLTNLAVAEPSIAREIAAYQKALASNDNASSVLVAEEQQNKPQ